MSIDIVDESSESWVDPHRIDSLITFVLDRLRLDPDCTVSVACVDEDRMAQLHQQWMDEPGPTDVMSFPMDEMRPGPVDGPAPKGILGDIVLCPAFAERQAVGAGHAREDEMDLLVTHGMLHLVGFDHAEPEEHRVMFDLQGELLEAWRTATRGER